MNRLPLTAQQSLGPASTLYRSLHPSTAIESRSSASAFVTAAYCKCAMRGRKCEPGPDGWKCRDGSSTDICWAEYAADQDLNPIEYLACDSYSPYQNCKICPKG
ncbi:MAG: hypothetical protein AAGD06_31255 [Acidobacteriota bacterium]